jgi:hypothetical protein
MKSFIVATLIATLLPTAALATTGMPGRGGDGHCPIKELATDPDCAREGAQWRGTGREQAKSSGTNSPSAELAVAVSRPSTPARVTPAMSSLAIAPGNPATLAN